MLIKVCALIEYERTEFALKAVKDLHQEEEEKIKVKMSTYANVFKPRKIDDSEMLFKAFMLVTCYVRDAPIIYYFV